MTLNLFGSQFYLNQLKLAKRVNLFDYSLEELQAVHEYLAVNESLLKTSFE